MFAKPFSFTFPKQPSIKDCDVIPRAQKPWFPLATMAIDSAKVRDLGKIFPLLRSSTVHELMHRNKPTITVKSSDLAPTVMDKLKSNHIQGALVVDDRGKPEGWVDVLDIMANMLYRANFPGVHFTDEDREKLTQDGKDFAQRTCKDLLNASGRDPLVNMVHTDPLFDAIKNLTKTHRILVSYYEERHVVAQLDVVSWLLHHQSAVRAMLHKKLIEAGLIPTDVVGTMTENSSIMGAMRYMRDCGVSGIGVVDGNGALVANLSASDFLNVPLDKFSVFAGTIKEFLRQTRSGPNPPVTCRLDDAMEILLNRMDQHKVHRVYIVDNKKKPVGFLSLTDIMAFLTATAS